MRKKLAVLLLATSLSALIFLLPGCGEEKKSGTQTQETQQQQLSDEEISDSMLGKKLAELEKLEAAVEIIKDGKSSGKWSQKAGSWRLDAQGLSIIFNATQQKLWVLAAGAATEVSPAQVQQYANISPAALLRIYAAYPWNEAGNKLELNAPGQDQITVELGGPQGLPTKITTVSATTGATSTTEFIYSNVGAVDSSLFELPAGVTATPAPQASNSSNNNPLAGMGSGTILGAENGQSTYNPAGSGGNQNGSGGNGGSGSGGGGNPSSAQQLADLTQTSNDPNYETGSIDRSQNNGDDSNPNQEPDRYVENSTEGGASCGLPLGATR